MAEGITMSIPAILRAWGARGYNELAIRLQAKGDRDAIMSAADAALSAANIAEYERTDDDPEAAASASSLTPRGPVIFLGICDSREALSQWLTWFADDLARQGITGKITAARDEAAPIDNDQFTTMAAALSVPLDWDVAVTDANNHAQAKAGWYAAPETTSRLLDVLVPWCLAGEGDVYLSHQAFQVRINPAGAHELVLAAISRGPSVRLTRASRIDDFRRFRLETLGHVTLACTQAPDALTQSAAALQQPLVDLADILEQGLIRPALQIGGEWEEITNRAKPIPLYNGIGTGTRLTDVRHLAARRVHDAYGIQILTDEQLAHTTDLTNWHVQPLGHGRHLVRAHDLTTWYADDAPTPQTIARARTDFGDAILTRAIVENETPAPW